MRDVQIDIYRAVVMIYIVTVIHTMYWLGMPTHHVTKSWFLVEMPLMFFIAGASYKLSYKPQRTYAKYIVSRLRRILLPYIGWVLLCVSAIGCVSFVAAHFFGVVTYRWEWFKDYNNYLPFLKCTHSLLVPKSYHLWFIPIYLYVCLLAPLLYKFHRAGRSVAVIVSGVAFLVFADAMHLGISIVRSVVVYSLFFVMGFYYREIRRKSCLAVSLAAYAACAALYFLGIYGCDMQENKFPPNLLFMLYGTGFVTLAGWLQGGVRLPNNRVFDFYNKQGYTIYLYQNIGFTVAGFVFPPLFCAVSGAVLKLAVTAATLVFLFFFHALLAYVLSLKPFKR